MAVRPNLTTAIDNQALLALGQPPSGSVYRFFLNLAAKIDTRSKRALSGEVLKVRTGNLRSSQTFRVEVEGGILRAINENTASYAEALHKGSRPHLIYGRRSPMRLLTGWTFNGAPVFTPVVHHPGTKPHPWMTDAQREVISQLH